MIEYGLKQEAMAMALAGEYQISAACCYAAGHRPNAYGWTETTLEHSTLLPVTMHHSQLTPRKKQFHQFSVNIQFTMWNKCQTDASHSLHSYCILHHLFADDIIIIIIIKNECHSNIIVDRLQGCSHSKKLRESESESESRSSKVVWQAWYQL